MEEQLNKMISTYSILVVGNSSEDETQLCTDIIENAGASYHFHDIWFDDNKESWSITVESKVGTSKFPIIFIGGELFGGYSELSEADKNNQLIPKLCSLNIPNITMPGDDSDMLVRDPNYEENEDDDGGMWGLFDF